MLYVRLFLSCLCELCNAAFTVVSVGDINLPHISWNKTPLTAKYDNACRENPLDNLEFANDPQVIRKVNKLTSYKYKSFTPLEIARHSS
jgi:hypothetical protein